MNYSLSLSGKQYKNLKKHLFSDSLESAALVLCHQAKGKHKIKLIASKIVYIENNSSERSEFNITWHTKKYFTAKEIEKIDKDELSVMTIHSHPAGYDRFSETDDINDKVLFSSINNWFDDHRPNGSMIMLPDGHILGRVVNDKTFVPLSYICVAGKDIKFFRHKKEYNETPKFAERLTQTFGKGTFSTLKNLKVGVVGCSGTGSIMIELLTRNCIGELVIVDPDIIEEKNLNRIINSTMDDASEKLSKVDVLEKAIKKINLGTKVHTYKKSTSDKSVISALKECDILFGCVDSAIGRYHLDCISSAYIIPYFDVGVRIDSDKKGKISQAIMAAHYIEPEKSSLFSRGVYTSKQLGAETLKIQNPLSYQQQRQEGYIVGVDEDQPAVISINMQASCMSFNDFMARIHNYRLDDNDEFNVQKISLTHGYYEHCRDDSGIHDLFLKNFSKADRSELLKMVR